MLRAAQGDIGTAAQCIAAMFRGEDDTAADVGAALIAEALAIYRKVNTKRKR